MTTTFIVLVETPLETYHWMCTIVGIEFSMTTRHDLHDIVDAMLCRMHQTSWPRLQLKCKSLDGSHTS